MLEVLGIVSGIIGFVCVFPYIQNILLKKTKPERASWFIWSVLGGIAFFSQLAKGATNSLWMTGIDTLGVLVTFILAIKFGSGGLNSRDIKALVVAFLGLVIWFFTKEAAYALFIVIVVDASGAILTILKAYEDPGSETMSTWILSGLSGLIAAFAVGQINWILLSYPLYICIANWSVAGAMLLGKQKSSK